jgi:hypothetical protein
MVSLGFPKYPVRVKNTENKPLIFDPVRKKWSVLTPEEWVRIHCLYYLTQTKGYPLSWIRVEQKVEVYTTQKRFDIVIQNPNKGIEVLVECKAPSVAISQSTFDQIARYNLELKSNYLMITNGLNHYFCQMKKEQKNFTFIESLPAYTE